MSTEIRNLAAYGKHAVKALARGQAREVAATSAGIVLRTVEIMQDLWSRPRVRCGFCGWQGRSYRTFVAGGGIRRGAVCPRCLSLERHRDFLQLFRLIRERLPSPIRLLDVAPNPAFAAFCRETEGIEYLSIDKSSPLAMRHMDVQHLDLGSEAFDVLVCSHVLDYVPDDRRAMTEFHRVLSRHGLGILQEGLIESGPTEEWGRPRPDRQHRIRQYGSDFSERLRASGFAVTSIRRLSGQVFLVARSPAVLDSLGPLAPDPQAQP